MLRPAVCRRQFLSGKVLKMRKRDWLIVFFPLVLTWTLDRLTKQWATGLSGVTTEGPFSFVLHHNHGAMLGLFTDLPGLLRIVTLSTGGAFILCLYAIIQYLLPIKSLLLRSGLSALTGGILGNVTDRIVWGYVVDFIVIGRPGLSSPAFNLADVFQWIGYGLIVAAVIREGDLLWPRKEQRSHYWINRRFQLKHSFFLAGVGIALSTVAMVFSYTYLRVTITELVGNNQFLINKFLVPFAVTFVLICIAFCFVLFALGKHISHRIAGPLYAFEKFLQDSLDGKDRPLKLRAGDDFKHLEELGEEVRERLHKIRTGDTDPKIRKTRSRPRG